MKKYQYLASWDDQTLTRVGEPVVVLGDSNVSQVEVTLPSNFLLDPTKAECRMYFLLPGEKESDHDVLEAATKDENGDSHVTWTIKHVHSQKGGRLAFSLTLIGDDAQWDSRTAIIPVYESRYQPESEEAEEPYTGRLDALEGSMAAIRGEFAEVQDDFEELKETATLGTPIPESLVANMTEGHVYIYTGTEPGYTASHVYYYVDGALKDGGVYGGTNIDDTLTISGQAADAKVTGDKIAEIKEDLSDLRAEVEGGGSGLTADLKAALDQLAQKVAYIDEYGQTYYDALHAALYPPVNLVRISCVYTQSGTVYAGDALDSLRPDLVVTAHYNNGTTETITTYTLSGTLTEGTNTISVSYGGKTITFSVVAQKPEWGSDYTWLYKASDGVLLSQYDNVQTFEKGIGCTEEINDNVLHVVSPANNAARAVAYYFKPETNINGKLTAKMRFNELAVVPGGGGNVRMQIGNASGGARLAEKMDGQKYYITVRGDTAEDYADLIEINLNTWYIVEVELHEGVQRLFCDGQLIGTKDVLNSYVSSNALVVQAPLNNLATDVSIVWIAYKNGD